MEEKEYTKVLKDTLLFEYPRYINSDIIRKLEREGYVKTKIEGNSTQMSFIEDDWIDLSKCEYCDAIEKIFDIKNHKTENLIELLEFEKEYNFCIFLKINAKNKYNKNIFDYDSCTIENKDGLYINKKDDKKYIKNNFYFKSKNIDNSNIKIKYPIINIIHKINDMEILEIRLSKLSLEFQNEDNFYASIISKNIQMLGFDCDGICFSNTIKKLNQMNVAENVTIDEEINRCTLEDIKIISKDMRLSCGSKAKLDADSNPSQVIPILGEIEQLIKDNDELFSKNEDTIRIKEILNEYIEHINTTSDVLTVGFFIDINNSKHKLYITHNYKGRDYSMFFYRYPLCLNEERMDYVRDFFIRNYRKD